MRKILAPLLLTSVLALTPAIAHAESRETGAVSANPVPCPYDGVFAVHFSLNFTASGCQKIMKWSGLEGVWKGRMTDAHAGLFRIADNPNDAYLQTSVFTDWKSVPEATSTDVLFRSIYKSTRPLDPGSVHIVWRFFSSTKITIYDIRWIAS